jgi:hypothetical protein
LAVVRRGSENVDLESLSQNSYLEIIPLSERIESIKRLFVTGQIDYNYAMDKLVTLGILEDTADNFLHTNLEPLEE